MKPETEPLDSTGGQAGPTIGGLDESGQAGQEQPSEQPSQETATAGRRQRCAFREPAVLAAQDMRKLRQRYDEFCSRIASQLSLALRLDVAMQVEEMDTITYDKFIEILPSPVHVTLFKAEPLSGIGIMAWPLSLSAAVADRLLGGPGKPAEPDIAGLTNLEVALMDHTLPTILKEWGNLWPNLSGKVQTAILGHESVPRYLQTAAPESIMLVASVKGAIGDVVEPFYLAFPYLPLEASIRAFTGGGAATVEKQAVPAAKPPVWKKELDGVPATMTAELHGVKLTARELGRLQPGDRIAVNAEDFNRIQLRLGGKLKFLARLGTRGEKWAVEINYIVKQ